MIRYYKENKKLSFQISYSLIALYFILFTAWFQTLGGNTNIMVKDRFLIFFVEIFIIFTFYFIKSLNHIISKSFFIIGIIILITANLFFVLPYLENNKAYLFDLASIIKREPIAKDCPLIISSYTLYFNLIDDYPKIYSYFETGIDKINKELRNSKEKCLYIIKDIYLSDLPSILRKINISNYTLKIVKQYHVRGKTIDVIRIDYD